MIGELARTRMIIRWPASTDVPIQKRSREKGGLQDFDDIFPGVFKILFGASLAYELNLIGSTCLLAFLQNLSSLFFDDGR